MRLAMTHPREEQRSWLRNVLSQTRLSATALAERARVSQPTLTKFLNDPSATHALSAVTISKIEHATGMRFGPAARPQGFRESEAAPYKAEENQSVADTVANIIGRANGVDPWVLKSRALESAGYLPGDVLIVDLNATPEPGDIVCAQLFDWARSRADTVFRIWEPPYLVSASLDPAFRKIFIVDNENVSIRGVVMTSIRKRQARK